MTEREKIEAREAEAKALRERLIEEYHDLTGKIVKAEAHMHMTYANRYTGLREGQVNDQLSMQIDSMKGYRQHLMRRMAMLGIELSTIV